MINIIQKRKILLSSSGTAVVLSIVFICLWGLKFGIDFTGGALLEMKFNGARPANSEVESAVKDLNLGSLIVQPMDENGMILRFQDTSVEKEEVLKKLNELVSQKSAAETKDTQGNSKNFVEELRYDSVGSTVGKELKTKALNAITVVLVVILLFIAWSFRKVSKPVASWKYGMAAIFALFHDTMVTIGAFAIFGKFLGMEVNTPFVAAILTVLGYSVMDTIVVFDRIRENLLRGDDSFEDTVNKSLNQTMRRSIYTSLTTLLCLFSILIFGGESIRSFALALFIGIFFGTYSSIFIASPILVVWEKWDKR